MRNFNKTKLHIALGIVSAAFLGMQAFASDTPGTTDTDSALISVEKQSQVTVNGLGNIDFGAITAAPSALSESFCIGQNYGGDVGVTFDGTASGEATPYFFQLTGTGLDEIYYAVYFNENGTTAATTDTLFDNGVEQVLTLGTTLNLSQASIANCSGNENVSVAIDLDETSFLAASSGDTYTDTLTVTVSAQ